jgi:peptidoglycan lytic transglycosylase F
MTTVYLRVGVFVVVVAGVVSGLSRSQPKDSSPVVRGPSLASPRPAAMAPSSSQLDTQSASKAVRPQGNSPAPDLQLAQPRPGGAFPVRWRPHRAGEGHLVPLLSAAPPLGSEVSPPEPRQPRVADLKKRGTITFLMYHSPATYFLQRGAQRGFEYELAQAFADHLGVELEVRTPPPGTNLLSLLNEGKGDIIAGLETTEAGAGGAVEMSLPYLETTATVVTKSEKSAPRTIADLAGRSVMAQPGSAYARLLQEEAKALTLPPVRPRAPGSEAIHEALAAVVQGKAAATVMLTPLSELAHTLYPGQLRTAWTLPRPVRLVWAVRRGHTELLDTINTYLSHVGRSGLKKILLERYFINTGHLRDRTYVREGTLTTTKRISRYDHLIARLAEEAGFDWRLVAALIFEESRFDHSRVSVDGAYGLMQVMPFTARLVGTKNYQEPRDNVVAGVKYLRSIYRNFPHGRPEDRLALTLASYVIGVGHVEDAQRMARVFGYDPHCWEDSMEDVLPFLENPKYHRKSLFGYAQGREAVRYVNAILKRYSIYSRYVARELPPSKIRATFEPQAASAAG